MKYILGKKVARKLSSKKLFVVGSGAIGCEREYKPCLLLIYTFISALMPLTKQLLFV